MLTDSTDLSHQVAVLRVAGGYSLIAVKNVPSGQPLFRIDGEPTGIPSRYSVQVGDGLHLDLPDSYEPEAIMDRFYWRFMNHSCEPTAMVRDRQVVAVRNIEPWQEITFHYNTTEYELAEPFECRCGSSRCAGKIAGFRALSVSEREELRPWLAEHLVARIDEDELTSTRS